MTTSFLSLTLESPTDISPISKSSSRCRHSGTAPPWGLPLAGSPNFNLQEFVVHDIRFWTTFGSSSHFSRSAAASHLQILAPSTTPGNFSLQAACKLVLRILRSSVRAFLRSWRSFLLAPTGRGALNSSLAFVFLSFHSFQYLTTLSFCSMVIVLFGFFNGELYCPPSLVLYSLVLRLRVLPVFFKVSFFAWYCCRLFFLGQELLDNAILRTQSMFHVCFVFFCLVLILTETCTYYCNAVYWCSLWSLVCFNLEHGFVIVVNCVIIKCYGPTYRFTWAVFFILVSCLVCSMLIFTRPRIFCFSFLTLSLPVAMSSSNSLAFSCAFFSFAA